MLREIELLGLDPGFMIRRYQARTKRRRIANPNAYLLTMARDEVAKRTGVSPEILKDIASSDIRARTAAVVATAVSTSRLPAKPSAALIAHLRGAR